MSVARRRDEDERGAVAVFTALILVVLMISSAFAIDLGMQRASRRDVQALSDTVALDLSRLLDGRTASVIRAGTSTVSPMATVLAASVARNSPTVIGNTSDLVVTPYLVKLTSTGGYTTGSNGLPVEVADTAVPDGVVVVAATKVNFGFANIIGLSKGAVTRSAVGGTQQSACFELGSYAAAIDSGNSTLLGPLNNLLGLNLALVSYQGLADTNVTLAGLIATGQLGTTDQLLTGTVTLGQLETATVTALQNQGNSTAAITALNGLIAAQSTLTQNQPVIVGNVLHISSSDGAALASGVNVLDLIAGSIVVANGQHAVSTSGLNVAGITGNIYVTQGIQMACGVVNDTVKAHATTSQIAANLAIPLTFPTGNPVLGLTVTGSGAVTGGLGNAQGQLVGPPPVSCNAGTTASPDTYQVDVNGGLLGLGLSENVNITGTVSTGLLAGLVDSLLGSIVQVTFNNVGIALSSGAPGTSATTQHASLKVPQNALNTTPKGTPVKTGSAYGGLGSVANVTTATAITGTITVRTGGLLGIGAQTNTVSLTYPPIGSLMTTLLGSVNSTLNTTINNTLVPNLNSLLNPLATLLGVNVGGADVYSWSRPTCYGASLKG